MSDYPNYKLFQASAQAYTAEGAPYGGMLVYFIRSTGIKEAAAQALVVANDAGININERVNVTSYKQFIFPDDLYRANGYPIAYFKATPTGNPHEILFEDISGGDPATSWGWDLGDGNTPTTQNVTHAYAAAGTYTVSLTVHRTYQITDHPNTYTMDVVVP